MSPTLFYIKSSTKVYLVSQTYLDLTSLLFFFLLVYSDSSILMTLVVCVCARMSACMRGCVHVHYSLHYIFLPFNKAMTNQQMSIERT